MARTTTAAVAALVVVVALAFAPAAVQAARQLSAEMTPAAPLSCYQTFTKNEEGRDLKIAAVAVQSQARFNGVQSSVASQGEAACMRAMIKCTEGYNMALCTKADNEAQVWKLAYTATTAPVCEYYMTEAVKAGVAKDVYCCSTDGCNLDRSLDKATKAITHEDLSA